MKNCLSDVKRDRALVLTDKGRRRVETLRVLRLLGRTGHFPPCSHGFWVNGYNNAKRHECELPGCDGSGAPCSERCRRARALLAELEAEA